MSDFISQSQGFLDSIGEYLSNFFGSIKEGFDLLATAVALPFEIISVLPVFLGSAVAVVVAVMIIRFIVGK